MSFLDAIFLGIIQGLTEFIPVSSSGHLVVFEELLGFHASNLKSFDVAVHIGTLGALIVYFWKDFFFLVKVCLSYVSSNKEQRSHEESEYRKLLFYLVVGTIPAVLIGVFFEDILDRTFRNVGSVAILMIVVGLFFIIAELPRFRKGLQVSSISHAIIIGLAQACALIPGVSRSGSTISISLFLGINRVSAARFSFLLGSIAIFGAGLLTTLSSLNAPDSALPFSFYIAGLTSSFISGLAAIVFLMKFLQKNTLRIFAYYRIIVGFMLLLNML